MSIVQNTEKLVTIKQSTAILIAAMLYDYCNSSPSGALLREEIINVLEEFETQTNPVVLAVDLINNKYNCAICGYPANTWTNKDEPPLCTYHEGHDKQGNLVVLE